MRRRPMSSAVVLSLVLALFLAGCGGASSPDPLVGTYAMDVDRTLGAGSIGTTAVRDASTLPAVRLELAPDVYSFVVRDDGTYALTYGPSGAFVMEGSWRRSDAGIVFVAQRAAGEPVTEQDAGATPDVARVEGTTIVLRSPEGAETFLRKQ
jgi:hypothetical protein